MKKWMMAVAVWVLSAVAVSAQTITVEILEKESLQEKALASLEQRIGQILKANGCKAGADGIVLEVSVTVTDSMETPTQPVQTALTAEIGFRAGEASHTVSVRGVGNDADDALSRAILQLSPAAKATRAFLDEVKKSQ